VLGDRLVFISRGVVYIVLVYEYIMVVGWCKWKNTKLTTGYRDYGYVLLNERFREERINRGSPSPICIEDELRFKEPSGSQIMAKEGLQSSKVSTLTEHIIAV